LGDDLLTRLEARAAAEGDDDVAELALERTAARKLHAAEEIMAHLEQVEPRRRHAGHVGLFFLLVAALVGPLLPVLKKARPSLFRFADKHHIDEIPEIVLLHADPRAADSREDAALFQFGENLAHTKALDAHAGDADDIRTLQPREVDGFDVLVYECN